jgi:acetyltransferase-like isoleucine patch superfamily enzyme
MQWDDWPRLVAGLFLFGSPHRKNRNRLQPWASGAWGHEACWNLVGRFKVAVGDERGNAFDSPVAWRRRSNADCIRERHDRGKRVNTAGAPAAADAYRVGISARKIMKVINDPHLAAALVNAQFRIRSRASVPLSTRLSGKIRISGSGRLVLGNGITLIGNVVPIELISYEGACITIGDHTFINYGSSISAHQLVTIGRHCLLGHYTFILDNNEHDLHQHRMLPPSDPVVIEDHVWIGSRVCILPGVRIGHHCAIGAGSIVTADIPPHCLAAGNPARVVRSIEPGDAASPSLIPGA